MGLLTKLLNLLGCGTPKERSATDLFMEKAVSLIVNDKRGFIEWVINYIPDNSVWFIEGIYAPDALGVLSKYVIEDNIKVEPAGGWPKQPCIKVAINVESKTDIFAHIGKWDFDSDFICQQFYHGDKFYLVAYDNLSEIATFISMDIDKEKFEELKQKQLAHVMQDEDRKRLRGD